MTQEQDQNGVWAGTMQDDHMVAGVGDEDFTKFLDLDSDFQQFTAMNNGHSGLDTPMGRLGFGNNANDLSYNGPEQMNMNNPSGNDPMSYRNPMPPTPQYGQYQQYQQMQMPQQYHVPPTPVSAEMHASKYAHQMGSNGQILFDHQQVSFTPLVSPAQTPMDGGFTLSDYGLADEFFSPLTSPAIEAQNAFGGTGTTASPIDLNADPGKPSVAGTKRPRRRGSNSGHTSARSVKQSPAMKPHPRRRHPSLTSLPMDKIRSMLPQGAQGSKLHPSAPNSAGLHGSDDSVSPEALSEAAMRPPPIPQPGRSPQPMAMAQNASSSNPVTPATLMRMPTNQSMSARQIEQHGSRTLVDEPMEDIMLPDAVASAPIPTLATLDTSKSPEDGENTPSLSAKSAKLSAASTPRAQLARAPSQETFAKPGRIENRGAGRAGKKRQSTSSATISPALRPKISPNITPLAPATGPGISHLSAETSALYLASKSNYQNILEGTHLPGVSYPETLAENLTSKRTSHKIAEQGRRNRINLALKEIEALLPPSILATNAKKERPSTGATPAATPAPNDNDDADGKASAAGQGASKASTVEMAIAYIKSLQVELKETQEKLEAAEKKIADGERGSSAESQTSTNEE